MNEPIAIRATPDLPYRHAAGRYGSLFLHGLREGKILASRCSRCDRTLVPPRIACTGCFGRMEEIVEVPPSGTLLVYTMVTFPFLDHFLLSKEMHYSLCMGHYALPPCMDSTFPASEPGSNARRATTIISNPIARSKGAVTGFVSPYSARVSCSRHTIS